MAGGGRHVACITVAAASPAASRWKNAAAAAGSGSPPESGIAVRALIRAASGPSRLFGTRTTSDSNGRSARKTAGCDVS